MRALGIDLGSRRVGVAVSDGDGRMATPYEVVQRSATWEQDHERIRELVEETGAGIVVVGLPLSLDGTVGRAATGALREARHLGRVVGVPVETYDERLTTVTAHRALHDTSVRGGDRRQVVDKVAAAVMLQAWLDGRRPAPPEHPEP